MTQDYLHVSTGKEQFKAYLRKIGSGERTSRGLSREEAANAMQLILTNQASPAQIGAFMIAHRIRRPEPQELAGMIDTYIRLGPTLKSKKGQRSPVCFGMPFDGRNRTAPIYPLTALTLLSAGQPVVLQGGRRMPIKYGVTTAELFSTLDLHLTGLSREKLQCCFEENGFALVHQPDHFPLAERLISIRDELGKRPPLASMELLWTAHQGEHLHVSGFVHPPTEDRAWTTLRQLGETNFISVKGLEGGIDLPTSRACITAQTKQNKTNRLIFHPREHNCSGIDIPIQSLNEWKTNALEALQNRGPLAQSLRWNAGLYFCFTEIASSLEEGIAKAEECLQSGSTQETLMNLIKWKDNLDSYNNE